jgi:23S rRNA maturation mini-RNase III
VVQTQVAEQVEILDQMQDFLFQNKEKKLQKKTMNTDQKVGAYGDTKTGKTFGGECSKENQNPNDNIQKQKKKTTVVNNGGGNNGGGNDGNNTITQVTATAPTTAEVSQATTTEADADTEANRLLKIKKKGRSQSIMTSSKGVTKTSANYSLGKPSLLGRV